MLDILLLLVLVHLSPGLRHEYSDEERHGAAHTAEVEEEAPGAELGEDEAGGLHGHPGHHVVGGDGDRLHHGLHVGAEPLRWGQERSSLLSHETMKSLPMNIQGKLTMARPELNMKTMMRTVRTQLMRVPSSASVPAQCRE